MVAGYTVLPVEERDLPILSDFLTASKLELAINRFLYTNWPNEEKQRKHYSSMIERGFHNNLDSIMLKVVEDRSGEVVGHIVWNHTKPESNSTNEMPVPDGMVPEVYHMITEGVAGIDEGVKGIEHVTLTHIFVTPLHRKRGIGTDLIKIVVAKGEEKKLPVYLGSEPQARDLFERLGFLETDYVEWDLANMAKKNCGWGPFRLSKMKYSGQK